MNQIHLTHKINDELAGLRLDAALAKLFPQFSRSKLQEWIESGQVTVNKKMTCKSKERVFPGQMIEITATLEDQQDWQPEEIPLSIVYEDEGILVVNKPPHLIVHPGAGNPKSTLVNALLHYDPNLQKIPRAGLIHRLDKDTSGLLVVAKTLETHHKLVQQMQQRTVSRIYEAIVQGIVSRNGTIDLPIGRHPIHRTKMAVLKMGGKEAITHYTVLTKMRAYTYLEVSLETGRTHQIRVHMAHMNHPILGDPVYGSAPKLPPGSTPRLVEVLRNFKRQALHARQLAFNHPITGELMSFKAEPPEDFSELLHVLQEDAENQ